MTTIILESKEVTSTVVVKAKYVCDRCGAEIPNHLYSVHDFTLIFERGTSYPDGGDGDGWRVDDMCQSCVTWLRDLLIANGVKVETFEWDY